RPSSQEQRWAEWNEPVKMPERPVKHQEIDPLVDAKAASEEMADRDLVRTRHLELEAFDADGASHLFDVDQDGRQIRRIQCGHRPGAIRPKERKTDVVIVPPVQMSSAPSQEPADLRLGT